MYQRCKTKQAVRDAEGKSGICAGSGLSSTTQELQLQPDNPALLTLLRSFDLGPRRPSEPSGVPYPSGLNQYARSSEPQPSPLPAFSELNVSC